eukprot:349988_1
MTSVATQLRELASLLTDTVPKKTIHDVKCQILSIADEIDEEKHDTKDTNINNLDINIDDILNEIDEKESKDAAVSQDEYDIVVKYIEKTLKDYIYSPLIQNIFESTLNRKTWLLTFKRGSKKDFENWEAKRQLIRNKKRIYYSDIPTPFAAECQHISDDKLTKIYDEYMASINKAPTRFTFIHPSEFGEFAKWIIKCKTDENNENKAIYNKVYQTIMHYAYWKKLMEIISYRGKTAKSIQEAAECYEKYKQYIDINRGDLKDGYTILHRACVHSTDNMVGWLLSLKEIDHSIKNYYGGTPLELAKSNGNWIIVNMMAFASMSNKMREKADNTINKLNRNK